MREEGGKKSRGGRRETRGRKRASRGGKGRDTMATYDNR